jgi:uncharacterized protein (DUF1778 family)
MSTGKKRTMTAPPRIEQLGLRLPEGTKERIHHAAVADSRNMTSWVQKVILDALAEFERQRAAG